MRWHAAVGNGAKWTGPAIVAMTLAAYATSVWWSVLWTTETKCTIGIVPGAIATRVALRSGQRGALASLCAEKASLSLGPLCRVRV